MEKAIRKEGLENYLVFSLDKEYLNSFETAMLLNNQIPGLLPFHMQPVDGIAHYAYCIDDMITLKSFFDKREPTLDDIILVYKSILESIEHIKKFLLKTDALWIHPDDIYLNMEKKVVSFCYIPDQNMDIIGQLKRLTEYFMNRISHRSESAVVFVYGLYKITGEDNCSIGILKDFIYKSSGEQQKKDIAILRDVGKPQSFERVVEQDIQKDSSESGHQENPIRHGLPLEMRPSNSRILEKNQVGHQQKSNIKSGKPKPISNVIGGNKARRFQIINIMHVVLGVVLTIIGSYFVVQIFLYKTDHSINNLAGTLVLLAVCGISLYSRNKNKEEVTTNLYNNQDNRTSPKPVNKKMSKNIPNQSAAFHSKKREEAFTTVLAEETQVCSVKKTTPYLRPVERRGEAYIPIDKQTVVIGSLREAVDIYLLDSAISRMHAVLELINEEYMITDLSSTNGTFLNGTRIKANIRIAVAQKDIIKFGKKEYEFLYNLEET